MAATASSSQTLPLQQRHLSWILLVLGLLVTAAATLSMKASVEKTAEQKFALQCDEIRDVIADRLDDHVRILLSGAALFNASDTVTRAEWRVFNKEQKLNKQLPGIQGIGFAQLIPRAALAQHIQDIRAQGFPEYTVRPEGDREAYSSIIYLEPFTGRNLRAFGYDMFSEPVRRAAMEQARDTDNAALSGKVILVQETGKEVQAGSLMYVPVYRKGMPTDSLAQRRAAIAGWVYSPYRMTDLMRGILGNRLLNANLHLQVFDGGRVAPENLLFMDAAAPGARFTRQSVIDFHGHSWTLRFSSVDEGFLAGVYVAVWLVLFGGLFITLLLAALVRSIERTRRHAERLAEELTAGLRQSENRLRQAKDRLTLAARAGGVGIWDWDVVNNKMAWDEQMYALYGITGDKFSGAYDAWRSGLHPEDAQRAEREVQIALRGEKEFNTEFRVLWPNGEIRYIRALGMVQRDDSGKPLRMIGTNWDITAHLKAQEDLKQGAEMIKLLLDSTGEAIYGIDMQGNCTFINAACLKLLGYESPGDLYRRNMHDMIHSKHADGTPYDAASCPIFKALQEEKEAHVDTEVIWRRDGSSFPAEYWSYPLRHEGNVIGAVVAFMDITQRKQAEARALEVVAAKASAATARQKAAEVEAAFKALKQAQDMLVQSEKMSALGVLSAGVAHELNNPLTGILDIARHYRLHAIPSSREHRDFAQIVEAGERMVKIVQGLLDFARLPAGLQEDVLCSDIIGSVLAFGQKLMTGQGVAVQTYFEEGLPVIKGDKSQIQQVVINFVTNAVDAMQEKGVLKIFTRKIEVNGRAYVEMEFTDNGSGISQEDMNRIFDPFFTTKKPGKGTGLGLSVVRAIIQQHHGEISVQSPPSGQAKGTSFKVRIPVTPVE